MHSSEVVDWHTHREFASHLLDILEQWKVKFCSLATARIQIVRSAVHTMELKFDLIGS